MFLNYKFVYAFVEFSIYWWPFENQQIKVTKNIGNVKT